MTKLVRLAMSRSSASWMSFSVAVSTLAVASSRIKIGAFLTIVEFFGLALSVAFYWPLLGL